MSIKGPIKKNECIPTLPLACNNPISVIESTVYDKSDCGLSQACQSADYSAKWVLEGDKPCTTMDENVWFGEKEKSGQYIIFDLGCPKKIRKITIQNHFNVQSGFFQNIWGVKKFRVERSNGNLDYNNAAWEIILEETLEDDSSKQANCDVPRIGFVLPKFYKTRFLRFYVLQHFGDGAGLQYLKIE